MHFNRVKSEVRNVLRDEITLGRNSPVSLEHIVQIKSDQETTYIVSDPGISRQVLVSSSFREYQYSQAMTKILATCGASTEGLIKFFKNSLLELHGAEHDHRATKENFNLVYEEMLKTDLRQLDLAPTKISAKDYAKKCLDDFLKRTFLRILKTERCYQAVSGINAFEVFDIYAHPERLISISHQIDEFYSHFPYADSLIDAGIRQAPEAFLTLLVMGRDPLLATLVSWLNDIIQGGDGSSVTFRSVSATTFIPRVCVKPAQLGDYKLEPGQVIYVMLAIANKRSDLGSENGLAFGYGPHFCTGYKFSHALFDSFKSTYDRSLRFNMEPSIPVIKNAFHVAI